MKAELSCFRCGHEAIQLEPQIARIDFKWSSARSSRPSRSSVLAGLRRVRQRSGRSPARPSPRCPHAATPGSLACCCRRHHPTPGRSRAHNFGAVGVRDVPVQPTLHHRGDMTIYRPCCYSPSPDALPDHVRRTTTGPTPATCRPFSRHHIGSNRSGDSRVLPETPVDANSLSNNPQAPKPNAGGPLRGNAGGRS